MGAQNVIRHVHAIDALNKAIEVFMTQEKEAPCDLMSEVLQPVAAVANLDRIAVFRLSRKDRQPKELYVWAHGQTRGLHECLASAPPIPFALKWIRSLLKGDCVGINTNRVTSEAAAFLDHQGLKTAFLVPIFAHGKFWGFVALGRECPQSHIFDEECQSLFRAVGNLCVGVLLRSELEDRMAGLYAYYHTLRDISPLGLTVFDENLQMVECNHATAHMLGVRWPYYVTHLHGFSPEFQPCGKKSSEKMTELLTRAMRGETLTLEWVHLSCTHEVIPVEMTLTRMRRGKSYVVLVYEYDLRPVFKRGKTPS